MKKETQNHLDRANSRYTNNADTAQIIFEKSDEFNFKQQSKNIKSILNIGLGNGLELLPLYNTYLAPDTNIFGIDLSRVSIRLSQEMASNAVLPKDNIHFSLADAAQLPFADRLFDLVLMNSLLHEVFSYSPYGLSNWASSIKEAARILNINGLLYIEDFWAPSYEGIVHIELKTKFAKDFYDYFCNQFRCFNSFGRESSLFFQPEIKDLQNHFSINTRRKDSISLGSSLALEFITHFRIFMNDFAANETWFGDEDWIEINERYYLSEDGIFSLFDLDKYINEISRICSSEFTLQNIGRYVVERKNFTFPIREHIVATTEDNVTDFIPNAAQKMKLLFKKIDARH